MLKKIMSVITVIVLLITFAGNVFAADDKKIIGAVLIPYGCGTLYSDPYDMKSETNVTIPNGAVVPVDEIYSSKYHVYYEDFEGWIHIEDPDMLVFSNVTGKMKVTAQDGIEILKEPKKDSKAVGKAKKDSVVTIIYNLYDDWCDGWSYTVIDGRGVWIKTDYEKMEFIRDSQANFDFFFPNDNTENLFWKVSATAVCLSVVIAVIAAFIIAQINKKKKGQ